MKRSTLLAWVLLAVWGVDRDAAAADEPAETLCVVTHVDVIRPFTAAGRELLRRFAAESRKDAGAVRNCQGPASGIDSPLVSCSARADPPFNKPPPP